MRLLLSPRFNFAAGALIIIAAVAWTALSITLTNEPANVLAMSGVALVGFGVQLIQGSAQMRKLEVETSGEVSVEHADEVNES